MQDRYYIIAIVVILAICCLGGYVAVSGYLNSNPSSIILLTPARAATLQVVVVPTDTPAPTKPAATVGSAPTVAAVPSPLGAFQTIAASTTQVPVTVAKVNPSSTSASTASAQSCAGYSFCPKSGLPDGSLAPGGGVGNECPRNFIWGRVADSTGKGLANMRIRFKILATGEGDSVMTKAPPDPAGAYNIPTGPPGGTWAIWLVDSGGSPLSPQFTLTTQVYPGSGNCPTRVDFVQQK